MIPPEHRALSAGVLAVPEAMRKRKFWRVDSWFKRDEMRAQQDELRRVVIWNMATGALPEVRQRVLDFEWPEGVPSDSYPIELEAIARCEIQRAIIGADLAAIDSKAPRVKA